MIDTKNKTINAKFNATMTGDYMPNDGFTPKQLEQLGLVMDAKIEPIKKDIKEIKDRLDVVEKDIKVLKKDVKAIKECPTIQKELKKDDE